MTTEPFKLDIAESFIDVKPRSDSFLDLPETDVDKLIDKDETKKEQSDALGSATFGSEVTSASEGLTEEQKNLLSDAEQFLRDEATKVSPFPEISTARESAIAKAGTNNGAAKILDNVNVLGAGDIFASCFLYKLLQGGQDINQFIEFAHLKTSEIIQHYSK